MFAAGKTDNVASSAANYIEDVFSTYLYTGLNSAQTITTGVDLLNYGGLLWLKGRNVGSNYGYGDHEIYDSANVGSTRKYLRSDGNDAIAINGSISTTPFTSTGFNLTAGPQIDNRAGDTNVAWTFRKQAKFFDVQTFTSNSSKGATVNHNLGVTPSFVIIKCTGATEPWWVWHTSMPSTSYYMILNGTQAQLDGGLALTLSSTQVVIPSNYLTNASTSYVMYVYASNAGGFGSAGTDNVITCGGFTCDGSGAASINLGYEPQWILVKRSNTTGDWALLDTMRGLNAPSVVARELDANTSSAETNAFNWFINSTGFTIDSVGASNQFIYIAIRRGPMKTPTDATKVFIPIYSADTSGTTQTTNFPVDLQIPAYTGASVGRFVVDRLRGVITTPTDAASPWLKTNLTDAESTANTITKYWNNTGFQISSYLSNATTVYYNWRRAPGFFDEVCYTGTGSSQNVAHNLGVTPELMIIKRRDAAVDWIVAENYNWNKSGYLNDSSAFSTTGTSYFNPPTSTNIRPNGGFGQTNVFGGTYVSYLFATLAGVSKVGTFTGTGGTQTINCGFGAGGARWLLVKRTDSTGNWYVFDSARGFTSSSSPYLLLNSTAAETTGNNGCYAASTGFTVTSTASATVNISAATYIFLAIA